MPKTFVCDPCGSEFQRRAGLSKHQPSCPSYLERLQTGQRRRAEDASRLRSSLDILPSDIFTIDSCTAGTHSGLDPDLGPPPSYCSADSTLEVDSAPIIQYNESHTFHDNRTPAVPQTQRRKRRVAKVLDILPEPSAPACQDEQPHSSGVRRVLLIVRDKLETAINAFGLWRYYPHRPSYDPDSTVPQDDLSYHPTLPLHIPNSLSSQTLRDDTTRLPPPAPYPNMSIYKLMKWFHTGSVAKSEGELKRLIDVLQSPDFKSEDLSAFKTVHRANQQLDATIKDGSSSFGDEFQTVDITISVPSGSSTIPPKTFTVPDFCYRKLTSVIRSAFSAPLAQYFHLSPFYLFKRSTTTGEDERIHGEMYTSDAFLKEHDLVQRAPPDPDDPACKRERIVAGMAFASDATHLASFGTAKAWPIYLYFTNLSKYLRCQPNSGASHHVAYIPSLPESLSAKIAAFHQKWGTQHASILTHCKRELIHAIWEFLLDDDFKHAYIYGMVVKCWDGIERRIFPRIFTYSADYPEKVLLATIRDFGLCPCPRCLAPKSTLDQLGSVVYQARKYLLDAVTKARQFIYEFGKGITGVDVEEHLQKTSSVPTLNAFIVRLGSHFNVSAMLPVDYMHEIELGVVKNLFKHLIRLLYAIPDGKNGRLVETLNERYRQIPPFGRSAIRRFTGNVSEMKKMGARHFEDLLQCSIPAFEGLLPEPHNGRLMTLLFRLNEWCATAKLRLMQESLRIHLVGLSAEVGRLFREFRDLSCNKFNTSETPSEATARYRRQTATSSFSASSSRKAKTLNLFTYKFHAMGEYDQEIQLSGTVDNYSTQTAECEHRVVKRLYSRTNKNQHILQIAKHYQRASYFQQTERSSFTANVSDSAKTDLSFEDEQESTTEVHHYIADDRRHPVDIFPFVRSGSPDPAKQGFIPKLRAHLLGRLLNREFDGDSYGTFTDQELGSLRIPNNRIYSVQTMQVNYTTYDIRRDYDTVNPNTDKHNIFVCAAPNDDGTEPTHPFWYAQVLGIFHTTVHQVGSKGEIQPARRLEFLWVRWYGIEPEYQSGFEEARLPKIGFVPDSDDYAFGFLDPGLVIRAAHLLPAFAHGHTTELLHTILDTMARKAGILDDWVNFYVNIFADRDTYMRYRGGGIGHPDAIPLNIEQFGENAGSEANGSQSPASHTPLCDSESEQEEAEDEDGGYASY